MPSRLLAALVFVWLTPGGAISNDTTLAFTNGRWFTGRGFEPRTMYSVDGLLTAKRPTEVARSLDLAGGWVVPPYGEAHNHNIDGASESRARESLARYRDDGVFYIKIQGNYPLDDRLRRTLPMNRPGEPDVRLAQGFVTASGGHPIALHEHLLLRRGYYPGLTAGQLRSRLYHVVDTDADLGAAWPALLAHRPDFVKAVLWSANAHDARKDDPRYVGMRGLAPAVLRQLVARAHAQGLPVSVHVSDAADFHEAVMAGVDEIVHSGGPTPFNTLDDADITPDVLRDPAALGARFEAALRDGGRTSRYRAPADADVVRAAAQKITVVTTVVALRRAGDAGRRLLRPVLSDHLRRLRDAGVRLAVGSDDVADTSAREVEALATLGAFDNLALLKLWAEDTPRSIFPDRKIGHLDDGYEASFLVLEGDPLTDAANLRRIAHRVKQGVVMAGGGAQ